MSANTAPRSLWERRRRNTWVAFGAGLVVMLLLPVTSVVAWRAVRDSKAAREVVALPLRTIPTTPTALFAVVDESNRLSAVSVLALDTDGAGGGVMVIPVQVAVPGTPEGEPKPLSQVFAEEGAEGLQRTVQNMTNSQLDLVSVTGVDDTGALIARAGTVKVDFLDNVTDSEQEVTSLIAEKGPNSFSPIEAAEVLAALNIELEDQRRTPAIRSIWDGIAVAVGTGKLGATPAAMIPDVGAQVPPDMMSFMSAMFSGPMTVWQLTARPMDDFDTNPEGLDVYEYDSGEAVMVMASMAPSSMVGVFPTLNVHLDSPYADIEVSRQGALRLLYMATNVMLMRQVTDPPPPVTIIRYSDEMDKSIAESLSLMLGELVFERAVEGIEGIDIQIVLGDSFLEFLKSGAAPDPNIDPQDLLSSSTTTAASSPSSTSSVAP
ncbi:MAG: hypothetical protein ACO3SP_09860 [Ilumatobacteraceae bacterium]